MTNNSNPRIAERVQRGADTQQADAGAIVPMPPTTRLCDVPIPHALSPRQKSDVERLLRAGYGETRHIYKAPSGEDIMAICRFDGPEGKEFRPLRFLGRAPGEVGRYDLTAVPSPRPLYNLHKLTAEPAKRVLIVEGEKACDAAASRFPHVVPTTWPGGAGGVAAADLRDLAGRDIVIWPDNDKAGRDAADKIAARLHDNGCTVAIVAVPDCYPAKWDVGDPLPTVVPAGMDPHTLMQEAKQFVPARQSKPASPALDVSISTSAGTSEDLHRFLSAARFLGTVGKRDYAPGGGYADWFDLMCAAKNGYGEIAFDEFCKLSAEYGGTNTEEQLRRKWDGIEARPVGQQKTPGTFFAEAMEAGWSDPTDGGGASGKGRGERQDPASVVLEQAAEAGDQLWLDQHGKPHVSMQLEGPDGVARTVHARVGGKRHKGAVSRRYRMAHKNKVLSAEQERRAMLLFEHEAREAAQIHQSAVRVAAEGEYIYIDLGRADGQVVRVGSDGWQVLPSAPVRFVRGSRGELPLPVEGGTLDDFHRHLNLGAQDVLRTVAFVLGALAPLPSFPILLIEGRQGTAKSTIGDMVLALCDPPHTPKGARLTLPRGEQNLLVHASGVRVVFVDNLSDINEAEADALCRLSTGGGTTTRQLYEDEGEVQLNATRPAVVTAIGTPTARGDFLDRCVRVTAQPVVLRRTEEDVYSALAADLPRMFGFVLAALACALRNKASTSAAVNAGDLRLARMADFGLYVEAAAESLGLERGVFSSQLLEEQATMQAEGALGEPLGDALVRYLSAGQRERKELAGHATEFLDELRNLVPNGTALPSANKLKGALRRIEPGLGDLGIVVEYREPAHGTRNRKAYYRVTTTDRFVPIGPELPF